MSQQFSSKFEYDEFLLLLWNFGVREIVSKEESKRDGDIPLFFCANLFDQ